jgi:hypothetical protein
MDTCGIVALLAAGASDRGHHCPFIIRITALTYGCYTKLQRLPGDCFGIAGLKRYETLIRRYAFICYLNTAGVCGAGITGAYTHVTCFIAGFISVTEDPIVCTRIATVEAGVTYFITAFLTVTEHTVIFTGIDAGKTPSFNTHLNSIAKKRIITLSACAAPGNQGIHHNILLNTVPP